MRKRRNISFRDVGCAKKSNKHISQSTNGAWWRSPERIPSLRIGAVLRTRASHIVIAPYSGLRRYATKTLNIIPCLSLMFLLLLGGVMVGGGELFSNFAYADEIDEEFGGFGEDWFNVSEDDANAGISPLAATAGLTIGGDAANKQVTVAPGEVGYREHTVTVNASDIKAYTLTISGPTNLTGPTGATTIGGAGGKAGSSMDDNTWGYGWGSTSTANTALTYNTLSTTGTNLNAGTVTNNAINTTNKLVFAVKFGSTNANTGHYTGKVTLSLVATPANTTYTITYNANGGTSAPGSTTCTVAGAAGASCTTALSATAPNPSKSTPTTTTAAFTFLGWADSNDAATAQYTAGSSITLTGNKTLYAVWQLKTQAGFTSITNMQQMTATICANAKIGDYKDLTDTRDSSKYRVVKFRDGRCWMTDNLKIYNTTIYATDSDFTTPSSIPLPNSTLADFTDANKETYQSYYNTSTTTGAGYDTTSYYNWYTATAGAGSSSITTNNTSVNSSICPKNWTLPTGGDATTTNFKEFASREFIADSAAGSIKIQAAPYNFKYTGRVNGGSLVYGTISGEWWSSTAYDTNNAYRLYLYNSNVYPGIHYYNRYRGYAVRCIARN